MLYRLEQPMQNKNLLYRHDRPNESTKKGPRSFILFESPFTSVSIVRRGHTSLVSLITTQTNTSSLLMLVAQVKYGGRSPKFICAPCHVLCTATYWLRLRNLTYPPALGLVYKGAIGQQRQTTSLYNPLEVSVTNHSKTTLHWSPIPPGLHTLF